jgi:hypothetical protein
MEKLKILVVDDENGVLNIIRAILCDYYLITENSPEKAGDITKSCGWYRKRAYPPVKYLPKFTQRRIYS